MPTETREIETLANREYKWGFVTDIEADSAPPGLSEDTVRFISKKKNEPQWMLDWRLKAYRHWLTMEEPHSWPMIHYPPIDYQNSVYFATTFKAKLAEMGIIFCSFGEAVQEHPELVKKYMSSVVPYSDNFYAT